MSVDVCTNEENMGKHGSDLVQFVMILARPIQSVTFLTPARDVQKQASVCPLEIRLKTHIHNTYPFAS